MALDFIYTIASYTYGPLLGAVCVGLFALTPRDRFVPLHSHITHRTGGGVLLTGYQFIYMKC